MANKSDLVDCVHKKLDLPKSKAEHTVTTVIDCIKALLKKTKIVQIVGFGTLKVTNRKARMGVNPKTGAKIKIKASKSVKFSAGKNFKGSL